MKIDFVCSLFSIHTLFQSVSVLSIASIALSTCIYMYIYQEFSRVISLNFQFNFLLLCCLLIFYGAIACDGLLFRSPTHCTYRCVFKKRRIHPVLTD